MRDTSAFHPDLGVKQVVQDFEFVHEYHRNGEDRKKGLGIVVIVDADDMHCVALTDPGLLLLGPVDEWVTKMYDYRRFDNQEDATKFVMSLMADPIGVSKIPPDKL
jgi:hypothetical protein